MFVILSVLCLFTEGLREDWLYQLSHPPKIKYLLTYLLVKDKQGFQNRREVITLERTEDVAMSQHVSLLM